ncbi:hypothetical protein RFI_01162 [Reticulomyxa filosa]|uniref:Uncharacterized protein n=1 Tax=Reticulomyxa filosa TaxID=46433 RepID=X6PCU0_RETFI|nr:hypothetical protein RFI_01162 [Reticulomyxa filosa]|eukprot:ETO35898.1 hypothetical protein RFI_01162 [Reticulomyxa filosa]
MYYVHILGGKDNKDIIMTKHTKIKLKIDKEQTKVSLETLDFKKHWSVHWIKANVEAAKIVKDMINKNEQGLIIITNNLHFNKNEVNDNSFNILINDNNIEKKQIEEYWMYVIKRKLIILNDNIIIDGNIYAIDCDIKLQGNIQITTQFFITKNTIINQQELKQSIIPIQWDMEIHHNIPVTLQNLIDKQQQYLQENIFEDALFHSQQHLQLCINTFGLNHPFVADSYNYLGSVYREKKEYVESIEYYNKALTISLNVFGMNHPWTANIYTNIGRSYNRNNQYDKSIEYQKKGLKIRLDIFGINHYIVALSYNILGVSYSNAGQYDEAIECYQKELEINLNTLGYYHIDVAMTYEDLAINYKEKRFYSNAIECYENALKIRKKLCKNMDRDTADSCWNLGSFFKLQEKIKMHVNILKNHGKYTVKY